MYFIVFYVLATLNVGSSEEQKAVTQLPPKPAFFLTSHKIKTKLC